MTEREREIIKLESFIANDDSLRCYMHVTPEESYAKNILKVGFKYSNFNKTVDEYNGNDLNTLVWLRSQRSQYGNFIIVIQIDKDLLKRKGYDVEWLSNLDVEFNEDENESISILPKEYIKGYFIVDSQRIVLNKKFNPKYEKILK